MQMPSTNHEVRGSNLSESWSRREFVRGVAAAGGSLATIAGAAMLSGCATARPAAPPQSVDGSVFVDASGDEVGVGGRPISWWAQQYGLPIDFVYGPTLVANIEAFKSVFARRYWNGEIRFAAKAESHPVVLKLVGQTGAGIDVASSFEARAALQAGIPPDKIDLNGNAKSIDLIDLAISNEFLIIVDSPSELDSVAARAGSQRPRVLLRISGYNLDSATDRSISSAGTWTKFGTHVGEVPAIIRRLRTMPVDVVGFHTHMGSQITSVEPYRLAMGKMLEFGHQLRQAGHQFEIINIGGGFPVSYIDRQTWNSTLSRIREGYLAAKKGDDRKIYMWENKLGDYSVDSMGNPKEWVGQNFYAPFPKEQLLEKLLTGTVSVNGKVVGTVEALKSAGMPRLVIEPGRSIAAEAGATFSEVRFLKTVANGHNLVSIDSNSKFLEGGFNAHHWSIANYPQRRPHDDPFETFIAGNLCFADDMVAPMKISLPRKPISGDVLMTLDTGAYNSASCAINSNSFPRPAQIFIDKDGKVKELRRRETYQQIFSL